MNIQGWCAILLCQKYTDDSIFTYFYFRSMYKYTSGGPFSKFKALFGILEGNLKNFALNLVRKIKERSVKLFIMTSQGKMIMKIA